VKPIEGQRSASILKLTFLFVACVLMADGCKKDSGPTGPFESPSYPSVNGQWVGSGNYFSGDVARRLTYSMIAAFTHQTETTFIGNLTIEYTDPGTPYSGWKNIAGIRGSVSMSRRVTFADTSEVYVKDGRVTPGDPKYFSVYASCTLSANGDTMSYVEPVQGGEVAVLVRQK
jgi:hypothetical protein